MTHAAEAFDEFAAHQVELLTKVRVEEGYIVLHVDYDNYEIAIASCDTAPKLLGWIIKLSEKTWMSSDVLERFVRVAAAQSGIKIEF